MSAELLAVLRKYSDEYRPLRRVRVVDIGRYSTTGLSILGIEVDAHRRDCIYSDGVCPAVGTYVQAIKTDVGNAPYLALPVTPPEPKPLLFSVFDHLRPSADNSVALVTRELDRSWSIVAHPIDRTVWDRSVLINPDFGQTAPEGWGDGADLGGGNGNDNSIKARLPLCRVGDRIFAWVPGWDDLSYAEEHVNGTGLPSSFTWGRYLQDDCVNCKVSDDGGATWGDFTDLTMVRQIVAQGATVYCIHEDGLSLSRSTDGGVTWTLRATQPTHTPPAFPGPGFAFYSNPAPSARWWTLAIDPLDVDTVTLVDKEGFWTTYDGGTTMLGPMQPSGIKLHFEGDSSFTYTSSPTYSDYWYDDFPCADVIRLASGDGYAAYWAPSSTRASDNPTVAFHAFVGADDPGISAGGTITVTQDFHPSGHPFLVDFTSRLWRGQGATLYIGTSSGQEASVYVSTDGGTTWAAEIPVPSATLTRDTHATRRPGGTGGGLIDVATGDVLLAPGSFGFGPGWEGDDAAVSNGPRLWRYSGGTWTIDDDDTFVSSTEAFDPGTNGTRAYATFNQGMV